MDDPSPFLDRDTTKGMALVVFLLGYFLAYIILGGWSEDSNGTS